MAEITVGDIFRVAGAAGIALRELENRHAHEQERRDLLLEREELTYRSVVTTGVSTVLSATIGTRLVTQTAFRTEIVPVRYTIGPRPYCSFCRSSNTTD
jgi:hypothetical protein